MDAGVLGGALTILGLGVFVLAYTYLQVSLWGDEGLDGVDRSSYEWARKKARQTWASWLRRFGYRAGGVLIALGLVLLVVAAVA